MTGVTNIAAVRDPRRREAVVAAAYLLCALAVFAPVLTAWFVADDWDFLILVARAQSPAICFVPLVGRFVRPLVMLTYYTNYHLFGLDPLPFHVTVLLVHVADAWLVSRLASRLGAPPLASVASGALFLLFAGHSEAVSWVAGAADPWLVLFLLSGLLLFARALEADRPAWPLAAACLVLALGFLAKETAAIAPALVLSLGAATLPGAGARQRRQAIVARTLIVAGALAGAAAIYLAWRASVFGSVFGAYEQLGTSRGQMIGQARAFLLRSFLPAGRLATGLWTHHYDLLLWTAALVMLAVMLWRQPRGQMGIAFLVAAIAISLAPSLPLTISLANTVSERYVYVTTAFSCILVAWTIELALTRQRRAAAIAMALVILFHARGLVFANQRWIDAGRLARAVTGDLIAAARSASPSTLLLVLNVPDTARGAFVVRAAFNNTFHLMAPDVKDPDHRVLMVASSAMAAPSDVTRVRRLDDKRFAVELDPERFFVQPVAPETPYYTFDEWSPRRYVLVLREAVHRVALLVTSEGRVRQVAEVDASPFGALEAPAAGAACVGDTVAFSGWALDDEAGVKVILERETGGGRSPIGAAVARGGARPDVAARYAEFPGATEPQWQYALPCGIVRAAGGTSAIAAVAVDRAGQRTQLGTRTITADGHR